MNKRILVCHCDTLMGLGVESLLRADPDLVVIRSKSVTEAEIFADLKESQPDILILEENIPSANHVHILRILDRYPELRVITIRETDNRVNIDQKLDVELEQASDLIDVVSSILAK
jgi:DNA-binding NarL/FixJ family response regulator